MIWLLLIGVLTIFVWYTFIKSTTYWKDKGVQQTDPWPVFGDLAAMVFRTRSFIDVLQGLYNKAPNKRYLGCYQFTSPTLLIRDPELIKQTTVKDFEYFTDHRTFIDPKADPLLGGMLVALKGQQWREMRATLSGSFTSSKMKNIFYLMEEAAENFVNFFLNKNEDIIEVEMKDSYTRFTNDVIATSAFGIKCNSLDQPNNDFYLMGRAATNFGSLRNNLRFIAYFVIPKIMEFFKVTLFEKKVSGFFKSVINDTIKLREEQGIVRPDMIHLLLEAKKGIKQEENEVEETGFATVKESAYNGKVKVIKDLTNDMITSQALIFFLAGFDTVSTAMCFGSYELAVNKDVQDKLRDEIRETYKKTNGKITYEALMKMKYLDMVISETLRMWSPASVTDRRCTKPYTIEPIDSDEVKIDIKPGDLLWIPIHAIHRDPANYPNPNKFDPERFSDENKDSIKPYTYIPFGVGPRNCIGSRFALLEIKTLLFNLLLNFEIVPSKKTQIPLKIAKRGQQPAAEGGYWFALKRIKN